MYFIIIDRDTNIQFVKQKKDGPFDSELKYVRFSVTTVQITEVVENAIMDNARSVAQQVIDEAESRKPIQDCRNLRCELHGLNSSNIAQIQHIQCFSCRDRWICYVNKKRKRRGPEPPPGLNPRESMEDVYDVARDGNTTQPCQFRQD